MVHSEFCVDYPQSFMIQSFLSIATGNEAVSALALNIRHVPLPCTPRDCDQFRFRFRIVVGMTSVCIMRVFLLGFRILTAFLSQKTANEFEYWYELGATVIG